MRDLARVRNLGLLGGGLMTFVAGIGMVERFNQRLLIAPFVTMGYLVLFAIPFLVGYLVARGEPNPLQEPVRDLKDGALGGLLAGLLAGIIVVPYVVIVSSFDLTEFFPNMRRTMVEEMTFEMSILTGLAVLLVATGIAGAIGGLTHGLSDRLRKGLAIAVGWVFAFALFEAIVTSVFSFAEPVVDLIYNPRSALHPWSPLVIGGLAWWISERYAGRTSAFAVSVRDSEVGSRRRKIFIIFGIVIVLILPLLLGRILNELAINIALFILMGLGLNIVVGYAGLLDLGYVAFFAVGAYGTAVLTSTLSPTINPELSWWIALPIVLLMAAVAGILVGTPVIRMRGDYLAIVTPGFGEIVRILLLSDWLTPYFGGAQGIRRIPGIPVPPFGQIGGTKPQAFVYFLLAFVALAAYISYRTQASRIGRAWAAMREDEDVAEAIGVNTVQAKLLAFVTGAIVASFAGALFSAKVGTVFTNSFDVLVSIIILVVVIVGGMGSIPGVMMGAVVLIGVLGGPKSPGLLQEFSEFKLLIYGGLLVYMMLKRPEGLIPSVRRSRELHHEELSQDAWLDKAGQPTGEASEEAAI
jgi:branched-chain amino acid transport system permease protein